MKRSTRKSPLEYHLFARFSPHSSAVRIGVMFSERAIRRLGSELSTFANEIFYKIKARNPSTKPYRYPRH